MLGNCIREARRNAGLKQETFAGFLKLSRASIVNIEKGRQHPPIHLIWVIARALNIPVEKLLPDFMHIEEISPEWRKLIAKRTKGDRGSNEKITSFVSEIQTSKILPHVEQSD